MPCRSLEQESVWQEPDQSGKNSEATNHSSYLREVTVLTGHAETVQLARPALKLEGILIVECVLGLMV